jgi:hypothetical protein
MRLAEVHSYLITCEFVDGLIIEVPAPLPLYGLIQLLDLLIVATA